MEQSPPDSHTIVLPRSVCQIVVAVGATLVLIALTAVAGANVVQAEALIPSILWLVLVGLTVGMWLRDEGLARAATQLLGLCTTAHFLEIATDPAGQHELRIGYRFLSRPVYFVRLPVHEISGVSWMYGQASNRTGEDLNDWLVCIDFPMTDDRRKRYGIIPMPDSDSHIISSTGSRATADALAQHIISLLTTHGATLHPAHTSENVRRYSAAA